MNRTPVFVLALFLIATGTALGILLARMQNLPAGAQEALDGYIRYRQPAFSPQTLSITRIAFAGNPMHFAADLSAVSFSGRHIYRTNYNYGSDEASGYSHAPTIPSQMDTFVLSDSLKINYSPPMGSHPIPFPPVEVWCVALNREGGASSIVFVAFHQDLYNADWLVHESPAYADAGELNRKLGEIGCDPGLAQKQ